jgi:uncharacterized protein with ACT and thioredoxin-like domain
MSRAAQRCACRSNRQMAVLVCSSRIEARDDQQLVRGNNASVDAVPIGSNTYERSQRMMTMLAQLGAALIAGCALMGQAHADECPRRADPATTSEVNLMGAITRVFTSRWLPSEPGGIRVVMGLDCVIR